MKIEIKVIFYLTLLETIKLFKISTWWNVKNETREIAKKLEFKCCRQTR